MKKKTLSFLGFIFVISALAASCSTANAINSDDFGSDVSAEDSFGKIEEKFQAVSATKVVKERRDQATDLVSGNDMLPPNAQAGQCYSRVLIPAQYQNYSETIVKSEASEKLTVIPAKYELAEETLTVKPAGKRLVKVPAQYGYVSERILDKPAHTGWKKGKGPITKVNHATGEILCKVEVPATYKTVRKRVLKSKATVKEVEIPAEYRTVKVRKLVKDAQAIREEIPAEYQTVTKRKLVKQPEMRWEQVICETNASPSMIRRVQIGLKAKGYNPGTVDGVLGRDTLNAVNKFQRKNGLATGGLTLGSIKALGVSM